MVEQLNFTYDDTDTFENEISELYSYSEEADFISNRNAFEESMEDCGLPLAWKHMVTGQQNQAINYLVTTLEVSCRATRIKSCRALAYLIQGNFGECLSLEEQAKVSRDNCYLLYRHGTFSAFVQQLIIEANINSYDKNNRSSISSSSTSSPPSNYFVESSVLRLILSVLCTITETMYHAKDSTDPLILGMRQQFILELQSPVDDEPLAVILFQMLNSCGEGLAPHFPVRKITLLLWKVILTTLGGTDNLKKLKIERRKQANLDPPRDDTLEVTKNMSPCSPQIIDRDRSAIPRFVANKRKVFKQTAIDDAVYAYAKECMMNSLDELSQPFNEMNINEVTNTNLSNESESNSGDNIDLYNLNDSIPNPMSAEKITNDAPSPSDSGVSFENGSPVEKFNNNEVDEEGPEEEDVPLEDIDVPEAVEPFLSPPSSSVKPAATGSVLHSNFLDTATNYKGLPWAPKVRKADLVQHVSNIRQKFLGYTLSDDLDTTFGLPEPIIEGINVLKKHLYISLADVQLKREFEIEKYPLTYGEINQNYRQEPAENLYSALLPRLPQYMISLLKIMLAASTNTKNKSEKRESINVMSEINYDSRSRSAIQSLKMNIDTSRHKEIIIKAISAILILLLKHFKLNHVYQFEYVSQQLTFANCIPLILKFLSQDIYAYIVTSKSNISAIDFPACVIGEQAELISERDVMDMCSLYGAPYSWRNMFSCINLVRILNKLTKWKNSRIMMLVVFKSSQTLLKALSVKNALFQLYILKLLKVQLKFLGRQWKKSNMKLISPIYQKVRHRLTDDWAYSNDHEAKPWNFHAEEFTLQSNINKFHQRRYIHILSLNSKSQSGLVFNKSDKFGDDFLYEDSDLSSISLTSSDIPSNFTKNYEKWLDSEVFQRNIDWDKLLSE